MLASPLTGADLKRRREAIPLTQAQLAERLGTSQQTVTRWETGAQRIERPKTLALALTALERESAEQRQPAP